MKKIILILSAVLFLLTAVSCDTNEITDQAANIAQAEDEHVQGVKNGTRSSYPDVKWADAMESYFAFPTWKYFEGVLEGPDEDGDGEPDYQKDNVDIVEFTGYCMYRDTKVKARIQFQLYEDGTFEPIFLAFNEVPMNNLLLESLINNAFEFYINQKNEITSETGDQLNVFNYENDVLQTPDQASVTEKVVTTSQMIVTEKQTELVTEAKASPPQQKTVTFDVDDSVRASLNSDGSIKIEYTEVPMTMTLPSSWAGKFVVRNGSVLSRSAYYNNNGGMIIHMIFRDKNEGHEGISRYLGKAGYKHCFYYRVTDVQYDLSNQSETEEYNSLYKDVETVLASVVCTPYEDKISVDIEDLYPFLTGQISSGGATIEGYTSDYVCHGGAKTRQWICEDTWHITAKRKANSYGVVWYECWDTDDGDYYGWIDSNFLYFYSSGGNNSSYPEIESVSIYGQLNTHGGTLPGYSTNYIVYGGSYETIRDSLGNSWHIIAKNACYARDTLWYECWDSDDGDYYGWVIASCIDFY